MLHLSNHLNFFHKYLAYLWYRYYRFFRCTQKHSLIINKWKFFFLILFTYLCLALSVEPRISCILHTFHHWDTPWAVGFTHFIHLSLCIIVTHRSGIHCTICTHVGDMIWSISFPIPSLPWPLLPYPFAQIYWPLFYYYYCLNECILIISISWIHCGIIITW